MGPKNAAALLLLTAALAVAQNPSPQNSTQPPAQRQPKHICTDLSREEIIPCPGEASSSASSTTANTSVEKAEQKPTETSSSQVPAAIHASPSSRSEVAKTKRDGAASELRTDAPPDANFRPVPNDYSVSHAAVRDLPRNLLQDQRNFFTSPLRTRASDLDLIVPFAGVTAVLAAGVDRGVESHLPTSPSIISRSKTISDYGAAAMGAGVAGAWLLGEARHDDHMTEAGFLSGEAAVSTLAIAELGKYAFGRQRPLAGNGKGDFFSEGDSFPSLHAAAAFSIATVMSEEYPNPFITFLSYGAATGIAAARVTARQHFASDVLVGAGLGWFMGRQVYRAHHDNDGDLKRWGAFERASGDRTRDPAYMGSPYVPLDSWVYPAIQRLVAMGYIHNAFVNMRPWTRMQCAEMLEEGSADGSLSDTDDRSSVASTYRALRAEFGPEIGRLGGNANVTAQIESIYTRVTSISREPLTDGYFFGQTIINDYGRPYQEGLNNVTGVSTYVNAGPLTIYVRGEYQHAPAGTAYSLATREGIAQADNQIQFGLVPVPPANAPAEVNNFTLLDSYVGLNLADWQLTFGKQSLWWGPEQGGPLILSNNAPPIAMIRINDVKPIQLPSILSWLGTTRVEGFLGQLSGQQFMYTLAGGLIGQWGQDLSPQPFIHGQKFTFDPTPNFEFSLSRTTIFGGPGYPVTMYSFYRSLLSTGNTVAGAPRKPGKRTSGVDFTYRLPYVRNWLTFYADGLAYDQFTPIAYWDRSMWDAGLYMPRVPMLNKLELRAEGVFTDNPIGGIYDNGYYYTDGTWRSGYTNDGYLLGSWIGREGQGAQAWATYHLTRSGSLQWSFRHQKVSKNFIAGGGTLTDASVSADFRVRPELGVTALVGYEKWNYPLISILPHSPIVTSVQLTYWPHIWPH